VIAKAMFTYSPFDYNLFLTNTTERKAGAFGQKTRPGCVQNTSEKSRKSNTRESSTSMLFALKS
jgi:hypothetical protein